MVSEDSTSKVIVLPVKVLTKICILVRLQKNASFLPKDEEIFFISSFFIADGKRRAWTSDGNPRGNSAVTGFMGARPAISHWLRNQPPQMIGDRVLNNRIAIYGYVHPSDVFESNSSIELEPPRLTMTQKLIIFLHLCTCKH